MSVKASTVVNHTEEDLGPEEAKNGGTETVMMDMDTKQ